MLTVFRSVRPGGKGPAGLSAPASVGMVVVEFVCPLGVGRWGNAEEETARLVEEGDGSNEEGDRGEEVTEAKEATEATEVRDLGTGSDGRGPVGGATEGREGRGRVVVVMVEVVVESGRCCYDAKIKTRACTKESSLSDPFHPTYGAAFISPKVCSGTPKD